VKKIFFFLLM
jgi:stearoyl-CoA desaturase (delta-9 desaturase)